MFVPAGYAEQHVCVLAHQIRELGAQLIHGPVQQQEPEAEYKHRGGQRRAQQPWEHRAPPYLRSLRLKNIMPTAELSTAIMTDEASESTGLFSS